eukprot:7438888-Pyramimonas_sp.AAC.1
MLEEVTVQALHDLRGDFIRAGLLNPREASSRLKRSICACFPECKGQSMSTAKAVQVNSRACQ